MFALALQPKGLGISCIMVSVVLQLLVLLVLGGVAPSDVVTL